MNQQLAEKILANVMEWDTQEVKDNIRGLEHFAELKYDQYQQYQVGSRFIENLTIWLNQFENVEERRLAYEFVKERVVFISQEELYHLINSIYPDVLKPLFREQVKKICMDNNISDENEQVCINYEITDDRMKDIFKEIKKDTEKLVELYKYEGVSQDKIFNIFLLDDFSGSGISYLRKEADESGKMVWKGKITKVISQLCNQLGVQNSLKNIEIHVILYLATEKAKMHIEKQARLYCKEKDVQMEIHVLQNIHQYKPNEQLEMLIKKYDDPAIEDSHFKKGKHDNPFLGFDECSLPLVIYHNTPNNSFPIIWAGEKALFPRVTRHKDTN